MYLTNQLTKILYQGIIVVVSFFGLLLNSGYPSRFVPEMFLYYTILSNFVCFCYFLFELIITSYFFRRKEERKPINSNVFGAVLLCISVTMLIYWIVLVPSGFVMGSGSTMIANLIVHLIVPLLVFFYWIFFVKKGCMSKWSPLYWILIPLIYYVFTLVASKLGVVYTDGNHYPYYFINSDILGRQQVVLNIILLGLFFILFGYVIYFVDRKMVKK